MESKNYRRLSKEERQKIELYLGESKSKKWIAEKLNRSRSTVTREVNKWVKRPGDSYKAELSHWCSEDDYLNKRLLDKITANGRLKVYVYRGLLQGYSPELISGRIEKDYPNDPQMRISHEAIYQHIYRHRQARLNRKLIALLTFGQQRRRKRKHKPSIQRRIKEGLSIEQRPVEVVSRSRLGDWEGDLVVGLKQQSFLGTLVDRKSRYLFVVPLNSKKSEEVSGSFSRVFNLLPQPLKQTLTYDNGTEMSNHQWFTDQTGMPVYFAHPYSSWERGTNENTNGLIRRYLPKKTDFNKVSQEELIRIVNRLNNRPRKVLGYKTSVEVLKEELKDKIRFDDVGVLMFGNNFQKGYEREQKVILNINASTNPNLN